MKPDTHVKRNSPKVKFGLLCLCLLPLLSCRQQGTEEEAPPADLILRIAPLHDYAWTDRNQSGQPVDLKPEKERRALLRELKGTPPNFLILRGLGSEAALMHLQKSLADEGLNFPHPFYVPGPDVYQGIGFLSARPFSEARELSSESFRIRERNYQPLAGGVLISTGSFPRLWIWNQQAPSPEEPYERRRNEARILSQMLRPLVEAGDQVLLSLHSREEFDSPMLRLLEEAGLERMVPVDSRGDSWTHRDPRGILYRQDQWIFATPGIHKAFSEATVYDSGNLRKAGPYRHQGLKLP